MAESYCHKASRNRMLSNHHSANYLLQKHWRQKESITGETRSMEMV